MKYSRTANQPDIRLNPTSPVLKPGRPIFLRAGLLAWTAVFALILFLGTSFLDFRHESVGNQMDKMVPDLIRGIRNTLSDMETRDPAVLDGETVAMYEGIRQFYAQRDYKPVWTSYSGFNDKGAIIMCLIENSREYGLESHNYHFSALRHLQAGLGHETHGIRHRQIREKAEILLTDAALCFMVNLRAGYTAFDSSLFSLAWTRDLPGLLRDGIERGLPDLNILSVQPRFAEYTLLQQATSTFVKQTELTDDSLVFGKKVKDSAGFYEQVRPLLVRLGYAGKDCDDRELFTGLKEFQKFHGLTADGKAGANTLEALQMSSFRHYRMLALNLDRLRKQDSLTMHLLYVNIPAYRLKVYRENKLMDSYPVIVGGPGTPTPLLTSQVDRVITNPTWFVPKSIIRNEMLEKIKSDTGYLRRNQFRVVDRHNRVVRYDSVGLESISGDDSPFTLRQEAGGDNSLGRVKFIFSNPYLVFMHDTPAKSLFSKDIRALSHGCIRVRHPEKLAEYMLQAAGTDTADIGRLIESGVRREFSLSRAIPIRIGYVTCDVDENGGLYFYKDIYGIDEVELARLAAYMEPAVKAPAGYNLSER